MILVCKWNRFLGSGDIAQPVHGASGVGRCTEQPSFLHCYTWIHHRVGRMQVAESLFACFQFDRFWCWSHSNESMRMSVVKWQLHCCLFFNHKVCEPSQILSNEAPLSYDIILIELQRWLKTQHLSHSVFFLRFFKCTFGHVNSKSNGPYISSSVQQRANYTDLCCQFSFPFWLQQSKGYQPCILYIYIYTERERIRVQEQRERTRFHLCKKWNCKHSNF